MQVFTKIDATLADYEEGGRSAALRYIEELESVHGPEKAARAKDKLAMSQSLDRAAKVMLENGATLDKLEAWQRGFVEILDSHRRRDGILADMYRRIACDFSERRRYATKPKTDRDRAG
jgi:hypothetical protein